MFKVIQQGLYSRVEREADFESVALAINAAIEWFDGNPQGMSRVSVWDEEGVRYYAKYRDPYNTSLIVEDDRILYTHHD
jgi:hypothetical protein